MTTGSSQVEEVQGLYGPFQFPELLLQRIWSDHSFNLSDLRTEQGELLRIVRSGRWNRQGGPDFREAEIKIDGRVFRGDIEIHLREQDWMAHQHAADPAFGDVILHVVLFPSQRKSSQGVGGTRLPILVLLPHLWHDLEEYAADAAVSSIAQRPADRLAHGWKELTAVESRERIVAEARKRWERKVHYARQRIAKLGWEAACHHTALEILGYRFNRAPMLAIATAWPLPRWLGAELDLEKMWVSQFERWQLSGMRPANHPHKRLKAYAKWVSQGGDWPVRLETLGRDWPIPPRNMSPQVDVAELRKALHLKSHWQRVMDDLGVSGAVGQPRADNLWGDGLLPLLAANDSLADATAFMWWFCSWPGDQAANLAQAARVAQIADGRRNPLAWGHVQGLLGQQLAAEAVLGRGT